MMTVSTEAAPACQVCSERWDRQRLHAREEPFRVVEAETAPACREGGAGRMSGGDDRCAEPERFDAFASEKGAWLQVHGRAGMSHEPPEVDPGLDRNVAEPGAVRPRRCDTVFDDEHVFAGEASDDPGSQVGYVGSALGRIGFI